MQSSSSQTCPDPNRHRSALRTSKRTLGQRARRHKNDHDDKDGGTEVHLMCARLVDRFAFEIVVVVRFDQLEPGNWLAETAEPVLHVVEQREGYRGKEQCDQQ